MNACFADQIVAHFAGDYFIGPTAAFLHHSAVEVAPSSFGTRWLD
jgi:hypothetical protein